jgi:hypothetical protein
MACCPTIISTLNQIVPLETGGFAEAGDIQGAYFYVYKYMKFTTTDYYKIRRPVPPSVVIIPSFPSPPGSGDSDPGPGAGSSSTWQDILSFLLDLLAWAAYIIEVAIWPAAVIAGIIAGTLTYPLRWVLYEYLELPLYNLWLGLHTYLAMTGYVMPMPGEISSGLNTLGKSVDDAWQVTLAALNDPDGGITPATVSADPSGQPRTGFPKDVVMDPPSAINGFAQMFAAGGVEVNGEFPSEFTRPWRWPGADNQGDAVNIEQPPSVAGPFVAGMDATALFGALAGTANARAQFENAQSAAETMSAAASLLPLGEHLGDPKDFTSYLVARLTRNTLDPKTATNFNLDADRGYGFLCWDWVRSRETTSAPSAFFGMARQNTGIVDNASQHIYSTPRQPGYGWNPDDQHPPTSQGSFNPQDPLAVVKVRYIGREGRP